jgi:4-amino-4-deoxy-L-arabinose transferase-like glycosyltransferase
VPKPGVDFIVMTSDQAGAERQPADSDAGTASSAGSARGGGRTSWRHDMAWLTVVFGLLHFALLGRAPLANPDEGRYAEISREMIASGDWVTPRLDGVKYFEKPPLFFWIEAAFQLAFGPGETAVRAPVALFALGGVLLTYAAGRRLYGRRSGLFAAIVLGTSLLYFCLGRILLIDMAVSVLMSAALVCFIAGVGDPPGRRRRWLFLGLYAGAALATLTKGLIGFLVPGAVMFIWLLVFNQWRRLRPLYLPTGVAFFLLIAVPWHVLAALRDPEWARFYFVQEHWLRFFTRIHDRFEPWWFFIPIVLLGLFPWVGFLVPAVRSALAGGWRRRGHNTAAWFLVTWAAFIFVFFSMSRSKLVAYVLPVFPPLAVLIGAWLDRNMLASSAAWRRALGLFGVLCAVLATGVLVIVFRPDVLHNPERVAQVTPYAWAAAAALAAGAVAGLACQWRSVAPCRGLAALLGAVVTFYAVLAAAAPHLVRPGTRDLALFARTHVGPDEMIYHYQAYYHDFTYYARRTVGTVDSVSELGLAIDPEARASGRFLDEAGFLRLWGGPSRLWLVVHKRNTATLFSDPGFRHHAMVENRDFLLLSNQP